MAYPEVLISLFNDTYMRKPIGTPMACITEYKRKSKWSEIICQFFDPKPVCDKVGNVIRVPRIYWHERLVPNFFTQAQWDALISVWSPGLKKKALEAERYKDILTFWNSDIETISGLRGLLGKDARGDVDKLDTWVWGSEEKRLFYPMLVECTDEVGEGLLSYVKLDGLMTAVYNLDFDAIPGLSKKTKTEILNTSIVKEPRRNQVAPYAAFIRKVQ